MPSLTLDAETRPSNAIARALWHLELGYPIETHDRIPGDDFCEDEGGAYLGEAACCWSCGGEGIEIFCCDDICHGIGYCMHGDGDGPCPVCGGEGWL